MSEKVLFVDDEPVLLQGYQRLLHKEFQVITAVGGAAALSGLLRGQLYGLSNFDPAAYLGAIALFVLTVLGAALWPARRALRVDPMKALRHE